MYTVTLDTSAALAQISSQVDEIMDTALEELGAYALDRMRELSNTKLDIRSYQEYINSIETSRTQNEFEFKIVEPKAVRLEEGYNSFDIKVGLLASSKVKKGKSGSYIDVPFEHTIYKRLAGTKGNKLTSGGSLVTSGSQKAAIRAATKRVKSSAKAERLFPSGKRKVRGKQTDMLVTPYSRAQQQVVKGKAYTYTFRRVSEKSAPNSWIHPGVKGIKVFEEVAQELDTIKDAAVQDVINRYKT